MGADSGRRVADVGSCRGTYKNTEIYATSPSEEGLVWIR